MSHILIIGAGASGLMAACSLIEKNHTVTLVEARDRIGGRIHTLNTGFSLPMEAGAEFIHGDLPLTMSLVNESHSVTSLLKGNRYQKWEGEWQTDIPLDEDWSESTAALPTITLPEKLGATLLIFATLAVGLYPKMLLDRIVPAVEAMRFLQ